MGRRELIMIAATNQRKGSVVDAPLPKKYACRLQVNANHMDDFLPIIPRASRVVGKKVLFRLEMEAAVADTYTGRPAAGMTLGFRALPDKIARLSVAGPTDSNGRTTVILETRKQGEYKLAVKNPDVKMEEFPINIEEAWYEARFLLTHYVIFHEDSFRGELVDHYEGCKVPDGNKHKKRFLQQVKMQGSGCTNIPGKSVLKYQGANMPFLYLNKVIGKVQTELKANHSIAVDPTVLPYFHKVKIFFPSKEELGVRVAEDKGTKIKGHHLDLFMPNEQEREIWVGRHGDSIERAYVKYIGES